MTVKIFLCCAAGMSTSMVVNNMRKVVTAKSLDIAIEAYSISEFEDMLPRYDICMVAPQVSYKFNDFKKRCDESGKACYKIEMKDYGMLNGEAILNQALSEI
ncbi:PTS sugar transporter subunit IIB [Prodigiosinella confusarubida]|uniref:PTS sugar transporter subunit IIB n=1 Tax=Serratia sp. (strain ATCC 39006) TaxID=104623 RepID=A0A2I5T9V1_SERS3|nr:PTS sugar transporter subunit IIB [Serratia sp. ATCC 39006]AUH01326.1 PTS sugar transporter subunit IIB [Serratia sp. ATCC 39006]AUH05647.1 PTS sugar transporter subunit IIB [Serratia sp. ATCC 39006]